MKCHVLIPVGPGHEAVKDRALESVRIAMRYNPGPFDDIRVRMCDDTQGELGRSAARNLLVQESDAPWLFHLDADDLVAAEAFDVFDDNTVSFKDALFGSISEYSNGVILPRYQSSVWDVTELLDTDPYLTLQMGHFVRRDVAEQLPFDESMNCGEDFDYYLRLWDRFDCFKADAPLFHNVKGEHSTGPRSATGEQWREAVTAVIERFKSQREAA